MDTKISNIPMWAIPKVVIISKEIEGDIMSIKMVNERCIRILSKTLKDRYRVDDISMSGNTTIYTNEDGYKLYLLSTNKLMLDSVFGVTSDKDNLMTKRDTLITIT